MTVHGGKACWVRNDQLLVKLAAIKFDTHMGRNVLKYFQTDNNNDSWFNLDSSLLILSQYWYNDWYSMECKEYICVSFEHGLNCRLLSLVTVYFINGPCPIKLLLSMCIVRKDGYTVGASLNIYNVEYRCNCPVMSFSLYVYIGITLKHIVRHIWNLFVN